MKNKGETKAVHSISSYHLHRPITFWIFRATPKFITGIYTLLRHTFDHWFSAFRASWRIKLYALLCTVSESLSGQYFRKSTLLPECSEKILDLFAEHHD